MLGGRERVYFSSLDVLTVKLMGASSVEFASTSALLEAMVAGLMCVLLGLQWRGISPLKLYEFMCARGLIDETQRAYMRNGSLGGVKYLVGKLCCSDNVGEV